MTKSLNKTRRVAKGFGSIGKRNDGRWCGRYTVSLPNGEHQRRCVYGKTQDEVRKKLVQCIAQRDKGEIATQTEITVEKFYKIWMEEIVINYLCPTTIELYGRLYRKYILPVLGKKKLLNLNVADVQRCFNLVRQHSVSQAQIVKKALSSMLVKAKKRQLIFTNPARDIESRKIEAKAPEMWNKEQLREFLEEARVRSSYYRAYALMANYGLRRGEVLGLRWKDIDFDNNCIHIRQQVIILNNRPQIGKLKTKSSERDLPLNKQLVGILTRNDVLDGNELIFQTKNGTPVSPRNFYRDFQKVSRCAGLPHIKIHTFRHMAACFMRDAGVDPKTCQSILGHATLDITLKIYQHSDMSHKKTATDEMGDLLFG